MEDLPHPWAEYARLQAQLGRRSQVNGNTWGIEAALNGLLAAPDQISTPEDADRAVRSESRKERHRAALRLIWVRPEPPAPSLEAALDAGRQLDLVKERVSSADWVLLEAIGEGADYAELAAATSMTAGALRARVFRLRRSLRESVEGGRQVVAG